MRVTDTLVLFWGDDDIFSNFHPATFVYKGKSFPSSEHAFMWHKAVFFNDKVIANEILLADTSLKAKRLGREVANFDASLWDSVSEVVMYDVNYEKYTQNTMLLEGLLVTRGKLLVEASPFDKIWGIGLGEDHPNVLDPSKWLGENKLGNVLTRLRDTLLGYDEDGVDTNWKTTTCG